MSHKWVISDLHLGHNNILKYSGALRGGTTSEEHDEWIIQQWNTVVKKNDLVYVLGDVAFNLDHYKKLWRMRGQKILVRGNHDMNNAKHLLQFFADICGLLSYRRVFWLSHAPVHPQELRGRYNIHGHVHQNSILGDDGQPDPRYINACVEMTYGVPQSLDGLYEKHSKEVLSAREALKENKIEL